MTWRDAFEDQAHSCAVLGSPLTARVLRLVAGRIDPDDPVAIRLGAWQGDLSSRGESVALRLAGGLHGICLADPGCALARAYRAADRMTDDALWSALCGALGGERARIMSALDQPPQTNEVRRSVVLIALGHWLAARFDLPLVLSELGASAGLNLLWDRYGLALGGTRRGMPDAGLVLGTDWDGPLPPEKQPVVAARAGVDLAPLDPVADRLRMLSYVWPDQPDRRARMEAAMAIARDIPVQVDRADAAEWLVTRLARPFAGALHLVCHTVAWQYFPTGRQARAQAAIEAAGRRATAQAPLAWFGMEADARTGQGAALQLRLWPGDLRIDLGRADFHGRWVRWTAPPP